MNGRLYDPVLARFVSADPIIQFPDNLQSFNRYSYVLNNPMVFTDPSGFSIWTKIRGAVVRVVAAVLDVYGCSGYCSAAAGAYQGYKQGGAGGAVVGAIGGYVGYQVGINFPLTNSNGVINWQNVTIVASTQATIGCASAEASGGNCGKGAVAGAVNTVGSAYGFIGSVISGCAAGKIAGGSCGDGVINAVAAYGTYSAIKYAINSVTIKAIQKIRYFKSKDEYSYVDLGDTEYAGHSSFKGSVSGIEEAYREYGRSPRGISVSLNLMMSDEYLNIIYSSGKPEAVGTIIVWDGLSRTSDTLGYRSASDILAHEIGHTKFGGGYQDFPGQLGVGPVGNVEYHENAWRRFQGQKRRDLYRVPNGGPCYSAGGAGVPCP